jgi:hypothetical protein
LVKPVETGINEPALQDFERWLRAEPMLVTLAVVCFLSKAENKHDKNQLSQSL